MSSFAPGTNPQYMAQENNRMYGASTPQVPGYSSPSPMYGGSSRQQMFGSPYGGQSQGYGQSQGGYGGNMGFGEGMGFNQAQSGGMRGLSAQSLNSRMGGGGYGGGQSYGGGYGQSSFGGMGGMYGGMGNMGFGGGYGMSQGYGGGYGQSQGYGGGMGYGQPQGGQYGGGLLGGGGRFNDGGMGSYGQQGGQQYLQSIGAYGSTQPTTQQQPAPQAPAQTYDQRQQMLRDHATRAQARVA